MNKMILTAGPSITQREIDYVTDAVTNGVDEHWGDYIKRFEKSFAEYIGVKHAMTTSSCTGALHLALVALGIGKGDEVIVPDLSWIASASVICYTGAKPVFADVLPYTWCIDPMGVERRITKKTKAILPVHLYGNPADMIAIMEIANKYDLKVVEDAAPSVGAMYCGRKTGSFGDAAGFSFQGAKMIATGEGGMLVTDDSELFDKIKHFAEHGRSGTGFDISDVGFKYKMSNLQAALGLAQLERVEELIAKKRQIYRWYCEELEDIPGLLINVESGDLIKPIYWMTSIVLEQEFCVCRDVLMQKLKERMIDTRPFFPPMSSFKMFKKEDSNFTAAFLGANGINLPSGHRITQEQVKYVCDSIKDILKV
jgi:perosamine synthetase